jgi:hypothetical protein
MRTHGSLILKLVFVGLLFGCGMGNASEKSSGVKEAIFIALDDIDKTLPDFPRYMRIKVTETDKFYVVSVQPKTDATEGGDLYITIDKKTKNIVKREMGQ